MDDVVDEVRIWIICYDDHFGAQNARYQAGEPCPGAQLEDIFPFNEPCDVLLEVFGYHLSAVPKVVALRASCVSKLEQAIMDELYSGTHKGLCPTRRTVKIWPDISMYSACDAGFSGCR